MPLFNLRNVLIVGSVVIMLAHIVTGGLAWLLGAASDKQTVAFIVGAAGGTAIVWIGYFIGRFCQWLRRKQKEGDQ